MTTNDLEGNKYSAKNISRLNQRELNKSHFTFI